MLWVFSHDVYLLYVDNPTAGPGFRPEWKSLSLLRTVNIKIQQEWMITILCLFSAGQAVFVVFSFIYPSQIFLEHSPAPCLPDVLLQFRPDQTIKWFLENPMLKLVTTTYSSPPRVPPPPWKPSTVNHPTAALFHPGAAPNITFCLENFAVIWLWF